MIAAALSTAQLKHLNLSDNALGEKGLRAAAAAFQHPVRVRPAGCMGCWKTSCCIILQKLWAHQLAFTNAALQQGSCGAAI